MASGAWDFAALFPPLAALEEEDEDATESAVDIGVEELALPALEHAVDAQIYARLEEWNALEPASTEAAMTYMERLRRYRAIARWVLYENDEAGDDEDMDDDDDGRVVDAPFHGPDGTSEPARKRRRHRRNRRRREQEIAKYRELFGRLPPIEELREARRPSPRIEDFLARYPVKKRNQLTKRSATDTQTALSFEFARRPPPPVIRALHGPEGTADPGAELSEAGDDPAAAPALQAPTVTSAATWRTRTLLAAAAAATEAPTTSSTADAATTEADDVTGDLIFWIDVLHPTKDPSRTQSFLVRGSQPLTELFDLVMCANDQRLEAHGRRSRLVYFGRRFYADRRFEGNVDYSEEILEWIRADPARGEHFLGSTETVPATEAMESTTFADLAIRLNVPGVYIHQGECEHLIRLRDVRLPRAIDSTDLGDFPMRLPNTLYKQLRNCMICQHYSAKFVSYGDRLSTSDPMFFCERCYRTAHYDADGKLIYSDFQSFPFIQE